MNVCVCVLFYINNIHNVKKPQKASGKIAIYTQIRARHVFLFFFQMVDGQVYVCKFLITQLIAKSCRRAHTHL